ncbi:hypothetical protein JG688_00004815 [Phytophthora aleatoria]|uniref:Uncharacterized protein n=1 Tax=Phytophthora aleatoria TaxID=2496075 RepID=A0A8J5JA53_9STRA|nr:hypothetical protein JG688_00004815 [Phytophthora aleatoria]
MAQRRLTITNEMVNTMRALKRGGAKPQVIVDALHIKKKQLQSVYRKATKQDEASVSSEEQLHQVSPPPGNPVPSQTTTMTPQTPVYATYYAALMSASERFIAAAQQEIERLNHHNFGDADAVHDMQMLKIYTFGCVKRSWSAGHACFSVCDRSRWCRSFFCLLLFESMV